MEDRRAFLKRLVPRLIGLAAPLSLGMSLVQPLSAQTSAPPPAPPLPFDDPKYRDLFKELSQKHQFDPAGLRALFEKVALQPEIIEKFERPPEILPYYEYRKRFINEELILLSRAYLTENVRLFENVEDEFGVQKEIICSILAIETKFGQQGIEKYRAFDALNTAFSLYPRRELFYRDELIAYLLLCREEGIDPFSVNSSYAGAFGAPQFMPSSFRKYAVDYDKDGKRDLWRSKGDIFASVANYLKVFRWRRNGLTRLPARLANDSPELRKSVGLGIRKTFPVSAATQMGVHIPLQSPAPAEDEVSFAFYEPEQGVETLLALFENFRAITRYNFSVNYALTVTELSEVLSKKEVS